MPKIWISEDEAYPVYGFAEKGREKYSIHVTTKELAFIRRAESQWYKAQDLLRKKLEEFYHD